eukprot:708380-Prymnesium_polylepis.1
MWKPAAFQFCRRRDDSWIPDWVFPAIGTNRANPVFDDRITSSTTSAPSGLSHNVTSLQDTPCPWPQSACSPMRGPPSPAMAYSNASRAATVLLGRRLRDAVAQQAQHQRRARALWGVRHATLLHEVLVVHLRALVLGHVGEFQPIEQHVVLSPQRVC